MDNYPTELNPFYYVYLWDKDRITYLTDSASEGRRWSIHKTEALVFTLARSAMATATALSAEVGILWTRSKVEEFTEKEREAHE